MARHADQLEEIAAVEDAVGLWLARNTDWPPDAVHKRDKQPEEPEYVHVGIGYNDDLGDLQRPGRIRLTKGTDALHYAAGPVRVDVPALYNELGLDPEGPSGECERDGCSEPAVEFVIYAAADRVQECCEDCTPTSVPLLERWPT